MRGRKSTKSRRNAGFCGLSTVKPCVGMAAWRRLAFDGAESAGRFWCVEPSGMQRKRKTRPGGRASHAISNETQYIRALIEGCHAGLCQKLRNVVGTGGEIDTPLTQPCSPIVRVYARGLMSFRHCHGIGILGLGSVGSRHNAGGGFDFSAPSLLPPWAQS
jgi:hypothetical protein